MVTPFAKRRASQRGSSIVEFALVLPVFLFLIFGSVWLFLALFTYCNMLHASQVAVRYAIVHGAVAFGPCTNATLTNIVTPLVWGAPANSVSVVTTWLPDAVTGSTVTITVSVPYKTFIPFSSISSLPLSAVAQGTILY
jgi:Flp pilus assembly protein TadG